MSIVSMLSRPRASISGVTEELIRAVYGGGGETSSGVTVTTESALQVGAVFTCVLVLAQSVAQLPLQLFERVNGEHKKVSDHKLYSVVCDEPNKWMTDFDMQMLIMVHLLLRGNSIWLPTRVNGEVRELIPINPDLVVGAKQDKNYNLKIQIRRPDGSQIDDIPYDKLVHFRGINTNGFWGINPIQKARELIGLAIATEKHGAKLFANGARLSGILTNESKIGSDRRIELREEWDSIYSGVENAHRTAVLDGGLKWQSMSMTAEDSQFLETRKFQRSEIAGWFRVPSHLINDLEKATFSNVEHLDLSFVKHSLSPYLISIEKTLRKALMTDEEKQRYFFKFNFDGLLRGDIKSRYEAYSKAVGGPWMLPNEIRELEDKNGVDGGDTLRTPLNTVPAGEGNEPQKTA